jgi:hypothetical protein
MSRVYKEKCVSCGALVNEDEAIFCPDCGEGPFCFECSQDHACPLKDKPTRKRV